MSLRHSIVLGIADPPTMTHARQLIECNARYELVGLAETAVLTAQLVGRIRPAVVLMADGSPGSSGRDVLGELARRSPNSLVVITTAGAPEALQGQPGVAEVVRDRDYEAIQAALTSIADFLDDPAAWGVVERRTLAERRQRQDWGKVFAERRMSERRSAAGTGTVLSS